jgi:hypothetical protein
MFNDIYDINIQNTKHNLITYSGIFFIVLLVLGQMKIAKFVHLCHRSM